MKSASKEILRFWKTQWEAYMKAMSAMQEQGETMLEMIQQSGVLQEGSQNMVRDWAKRSTRKSRSRISTRLKITSRSSGTSSRAFPEPGPSRTRGQPTRTGGSGSREIPDLFPLPASGGGGAPHRALSRPAAG